jgi:hypothetical protein
VSWVFGSKSLSGCGEGLARITCHKDVHAISKGFAWKGFNIRPDRCCIHESRFHFSNQVRAGEGFDLAKSDCSQAWDCSFKSERNASVSGAPLKACSCFGIIHIGLVFHFIGNDNC